MPKALFVSAKAAQQARGERAQDELILGEWSPFHARSRRPTLFDPDEVEYVVGVAQGVILAVHKVVADAEGKPWRAVTDSGDPDRWRVRFSGVRTLRHLEGTPSPVRWGRGQGTPVKVADASLLTDGDAAVERIDGPSGTARRAVLDQVVVTSGPDGEVTVDAPPGTTVTVRTAATTSAPPSPSRATKASGRYYTPQLLVEQTVAAVLDAMGDEVLLQGGVSLCDPALGSGAFLGEAIKQLEQRYRELGEAPEIVVTGPLVAKITERIRDRLEEAVT
ncbi:N-6 DNA methylase [Streptomyces sp. NPDC003006]